MVGASLPHRLPHSHLHLLPGKSVVAAALVDKMVATERLPPRWPVQPRQALTPFQALPAPEASAVNHDLVAGAQPGQGLAMCRFQLQQSVDLTPLQNAKSTLGMCLMKLAVRTCSWHSKVSSTLCLSILPKIACLALWVGNELLNKTRELRAGTLLRQV